MKNEIKESFITIGMWVATAACGSVCLYTGHCDVPAERINPCFCTTQSHSRVHMSIQQKIQSIPSVPRKNQRTPLWSPLKLFLVYLVTCCWFVTTWLVCWWVGRHIEETILSSSNLRMTKLWLVRTWVRTLCYVYWKVLYKESFLLLIFY